MNITEHIALDAASVRHKDANGFLHIDISHITKEQVCGYMGSEIGAVDGVQIEPSKMYYGYRPGAELEKAAATFNGVPILFEHHLESAENPCKEFRVGSTGTDAVYNAPYLDNSLHITDSVAIAAIESGEYKELSCAYAFVMDWTPGEFDGSHYDFIMRDISGNHVALVQEGRAGHDVCAADAAIKDAGEVPQKGGMTEMNSNIEEMLKEVIALLKGGTADGSEPVPAEPTPPTETAQPEPAPAPAVEPKQAEADAEANAELEAMLAAIGNEELAEGIRKYIKGLAPAADAEPPAPAEKPAECAQPSAADSAEVMRKAAEIAEKRVREDMKAKYAAAQDCAPLVGSIANPFEYESAEAIYKTALDAKGIDTSRHPSAAYKSMVDMLKAAEAPRIGYDAMPTFADTSANDAVLGELMNRLDSIGRA